MQLAQHAATNGDLATAVTALQTVATDADDSNLQALANIRLARVLLAQQQYDAALAAVQAEMPSAYQAAAAELQGDIYADQGQNEQAREAYQRALASEGESLTPALELKLNSLAAS